MDTKVNVKLVCLGDGEVGKTSIINKFLGKDIPERYIPTIGTVTHRKDYIIKKNETVIRVNIWDLGGQKSFNPFNANHYSDVDIALLVFDLTKPKETLKSIKNEFLENLNRFSENALVLFIGNKLDLIEEQKLIIATIQEFLTKKDHLYLGSVKTGENINECFELLILTFLKKAEIILPNLVKSNTAVDFLNLIGKSEKTIKSKLLSFSNLDSFFQKFKPKSKVKKEVNRKKENKDLKYYEFLKNELQNNEIQINNAMDQ
ncbi:MAG: Rab family GTPase, partial [Promethearchaeota archaeon]